jgi:aminoglycoside phosphotransferase (APT) family kinase protein
VAESLDPRVILSDLGVSDAPESVTPVAGGWDTALWRVDVGPRSFALRVFRPQQAKICEREALVMRALRDAGLPIPAVETQGVGEGRPALLLEWRSGRTVLHEIAHQPWRAWTMGYAMGRMHARIHAYTPPQHLVDALPRVEVASGSARTSILHLDFHPLNLLTDGQQVTAVLDWANAAIGDPRADLARCVALLRLAPTPPGTFGGPQLVMRRILELAWRRGYTKDQATDPFVDMDPFYVWAGEWMEADLRPKLGRPGIWLRETDLLRIRQWTTACKKRGPAC